jgi:hypothetical protein
MVDGEGGRLDDGRMKDGTTEGYGDDGHQQKMMWADGCEERVTGAGFYGRTRSRIPGSVPCSG